MPNLVVYSKTYSTAQSVWEIHRCDEDGAVEWIASANTETMADRIMDTLTNYRVHFPNAYYVEGANYAVDPPVAIPERYRVTWEIDSDAETPEAAAQEADAVMRDPEALPPCFDVVDKEGVVTHIDVAKLGV